MQLQTVQKQTKKFFDNTFENIEKNATNQGQTMAQSIANQLTGKTFSNNNSSGSDKGTNEAGNAMQQLGIKPYDAQAATQEMVEDLYEPSDPHAAEALQNHRLPKTGEMTPEEQSKYQQLKKRLHDEVYYLQLIQRKSQSQEHAEEEQVQAQEKQMEELQVQEQQKQDDDIALRMVTNKAEQFPGVAG